MADAGDLRHLKETMTQQCPNVFKPVLPDSGVENQQAMFWEPEAGHVSGP